MTRLIAIYIIVLVCIVGAVFIFVPARAHAADLACISLQQDREAAEAHGLHWLGIRRTPYSAASQFVYYTDGKITLMSPVIDGCVSPSVIPVGVYVPEEEA